MQPSSAPARGVVFGGFAHAAASLVHARRGVRGTGSFRGGGVRGRRPGWAAVQWALGETGFGVACALLHRSWPDFGPRWSRRRSAAAPGCSAQMQPFVDKVARGAGISAVSGRLLDERLHLAAASVAAPTPPRAEVGPAPVGQCAHQAVPRLPKGCAAPARECGARALSVSRSLRATLCHSVLARRLCQPSSRRLREVSAGGLSEVGRAPCLAQLHPPSDNDEPQTLRPICSGPGRA